jgi:hypothetical protein
MNIDWNSILSSIIIPGIVSAIISKFILSRKDKKELKLKEEELELKIRQYKIGVIKESSFSDSYKIKEALNKISKSKSNDELMENFSEFELLLEHICILILSDTIVDASFQYRYYPFIKDIIESKMLEKVYKVLDLPFSEKEYLFDAYELGRKKFEKEVEQKVKKKWWEIC